MTHALQADRGARTAAAAVVSALGAATVVVLVSNPFEHAVLPPCLFHVTTGGWCPGCGATRASYLLLHGEPVRALHYNALWVLAAPLVAYGVLAWAVASFGRPVLPRLRLERRGAVLALTALAAFFLVRNLPVGWAHLLNPPA